MAPDDNGNIDVTVPKPDLSEYAKTADITPKLADATSKAETAQTAAEKAQQTADKATTAAGNAQSAADSAQTAANKAQKDVDDAKITISANTSKIDQLSASISGLQVAKHFSSVSAAQSYSNAHPNTVCLVDG